MSKIEFAVNYSVAAERLHTAGQAHFDRFKLPSWEDQIQKVMPLYPVYVHLPLTVGILDGQVLDSETGKPVDWGYMERIVAQTGTPHINLHLLVGTKDMPEIPPDSLEPEHLEQVIARFIRGVQPVVERFGADRVILENIPHMPGIGLAAGASAWVVRQVVEETGAGLLLDISHAQLTALRTAQPVQDYLQELPVEQIQEIHVSGIRILEGKPLAGLRAAGWPHTDRLANQWMDHQGLTEADYDVITWVMEKIATGAWRAPWVVSMEVGGVGEIFQALSTDEQLAADIPRLSKIVQATSNRLADQES